MLWSFSSPFLSCWTAVESRISWRRLSWLRLIWLPVTVWVFVNCTILSRLLSLCACFHIWFTHIAFVCLFHLSNCYVLTFLWSFLLEVEDHEIYEGDGAHGRQNKLLVEYRVNLYLFPPPPPPLLWLCEWYIHVNKIFCGCHKSVFFFCSGTVFSPPCYKHWSAK